MSFDQNPLDDIPLTKEEYEAWEASQMSTDPSPKPITEDWLRSCGFKWEQLDRQPHKHWLLWIGEARREPVERRMNTSNDLGIEIAYNDIYRESPTWSVWMRADYCGRYSRFLHIREVLYQHEVAEIISALTGRPFEPSDCMYGQFCSPRYAEHLRRDSEKLHISLAKSWGERVERQEDLDPDKREIVKP